MTTAHIGDTRAIKATLSKEKKYGVGSLICKKITEEHRPEHMEEFSRITFTGARVQKLVDINGQHIGPYRVWEAARNTLGLKISRCLGSSLSRNCGIISTPGLKIEKIDSENDVFLVFGSSGFWEAFDSQELVNYIEAYRGFCVKGIDIPPDDDFITFSNTCIAQLACEEGRSNWISKIEDEDAHMEDLSCVIIELKQVNLKVRVINDVSLIAENLDELKNNEARKAPTLKDSMIMKESKRKSVIGVSILNSKTDMN
jgi:serine/threonine protein phosphatase PrpC